jgi:hypothetical protein
MKLVRWISMGAGVILLMFLLVVVSARFADGPLGPFPGGALRSGTLAEGPVADWTFVDEVAEVELQLLEPLRSRTTWIVFRDGSAYIPCGFPNLRSWKKWPRQAERDGRAVVRIKGRRYRVRLQRVAGAEVERSLTEIFKHKYQIANEHPKEIWFFRLDPAVH